MQTTKCFTHVQLQHFTTENQEQNCVLEIIWLALFPTICVTLLIIISYQWFKEDSSSKALNCRSSSESPQEITEEFGYANVRISGSRQQEAPVYLNEIQQEGSRRQLSDHVACSRENQHTEAIVHFQAQNNIRDGSNRHINRHSHKTTYSATESPKTGLNKGAHIITPPPNSPKQQNSGSVTTDEYANIHPEMKKDSLKHHHPSGENSRQEETPVYFNKIQMEGGRMQSSGRVAWPREIQHTEPIIHNQGMRDSVRRYGNIQQPNSEGAPAHEYANFLDLAEYEGFLTDCNLSAVPSLGSLSEQTRNVAVAVGSENHLLLTSDTLDLHHYHSRGDNNATHKEKRKILCL
ncbi:uncharacterized protein [Heterodontus francisci]|uniref:uncharacterized protein isoform X2 n=1 Tax=Heterodontus francisci TaxID=7792 RepID=UPI00355C856E